jgi:ABC-2 type transport system ATP-binding protein
MKYPRGISSTATADYQAGSIQTSDVCLLDVQDLRVRYGYVTAVNGVGFRVRSGEIFGLLGPNGAGKTSILSVIEGLIEPSSGSVRVAGFNIRTEGRLARANLGVQLQASSCQADLTIRETVRLYSGLYGIKTTPGQIDAILRNLNLSSFSQTRVGQLSGGQRQSVSLAIATLHDPALVLLDEPTTGLDPQSRRRLWEQVAAMRSDGCAIVLTTHSMEEAESVCDRIAIIDHGVIVAEDTPQGLIETYRRSPSAKSFSASGSLTLEDVFLGLTSKESTHENR